MRSNLSIAVLTEEGESEMELKQLENLVAAGAKHIHYRKPGFKKAQVDSELQKMSKTLRKHLVLHGNLRLAIKHKVGGFHFVEKERKQFAFFAIRYLAAQLLIGKPKIISTSIHRTSDLRPRILPFSYVFFSPVFPSISKEGHKPKYSGRKIQEALQKTKVKVFALGGVDETKIGICKEMGFSGVGLIGGIWNKGEDPIKTFVYLKRQCQNGTED